MPKNQKGFSLIIFVLVIILISGGIIGGSLYIKAHYSKVTKNSTVSEQNTPLKTSSPLATNVPSKTFTLPPGHKILSGPFYSPDHNHSAYVVQTADKLENSDFYIVHDNVPGKQYGNIVANIVFSPDSQEFAYVAGAKGGKDYMAVRNDQETTKYDHVYFPTFSPDSRRFAFTAYKGDKQFVVLDGKEEKSYDYIPDRLIFSGDSKLLAYHATLDKNTISFVVVNDKEIGPYDNVGNIAFSTDNRQITFTAYRKDKGTFLEKINL